MVCVVSPNSIKTNAKTYKLDCMVSQWGLIMREKQKITQQTTVM